MGYCGVEFLFACRVAFSVFVDVSIDISVVA